MTTACKPQEVAETLSATPDEASLQINATLNTIAFGSCNDSRRGEAMWSDIIANDPDLWIWLGDIIYADTRDMEKMKTMYQAEKEQPAYVNLLQQCPVIGIWDDHDYGANDGGKEYPQKRESQQLLLDFLDVPDDASVRQREGAYHSFIIGSEEKLIKLILLDCRYFRDELRLDTFGPARYKTNLTGDILGEAQWAWLESELTRNEAAIHLIGSGIQVIPEDHYFEKWANFPQARERFLALLAKTNPNQPILLSGDRHLAEVSKMELEGLDDPLYEITSSGLTHSYEAADEPNRHRVSELIGKKNFGLLHMNWSGAKPLVTVEIKGVGNELLVKRELK